MASNKTRTVGLFISTFVFAAAIAGYFGYRIIGETPGDAFLKDNGTPKKALLNEKQRAAMSAIQEVDSSGLSKAVAVIQTARGKIKFKFYSKDAPKSVARFAELATSGFYDGLTVHRVEPQFIIQGGDPEGTGTGGSGTKIPLEVNLRKHTLGAVAMAIKSDTHSADSQFYICLGTHEFLDSKDTVFGQVIEGQEVANQIQIGDRMTTVTIESP